MKELCTKCNREMKYLADQFRFVCPSCDAVMLALSDPSSQLHRKTTPTAESVIAKNKLKHGNSTVITENNTVLSTSNVIIVNGKTVVQNGASVSVVGNGNTVITSESSSAVTQVNGSGNTVKINTDGNTSVSFSGASVSGSGNVSCNVSGGSGTVNMSINDGNVMFSINPEPAAYIGTMGGTLPPKYPQSNNGPAPIFLCTDPKAPKSTVPPTEVEFEPPNENDIHVYIFDGTPYGKLRRSSWGETDYQLAVRSLTQRKNRMNTTVIAEEYNEKFPENYRAKQVLAMAISEYMTRPVSDLILSGDCLKFIDYTEKANSLAPDKERGRFGLAVKGYLRDLQERLSLIHTLTDMEKRERELIDAMPKEPDPPSKDAVKQAEAFYEECLLKLSAANDEFEDANNDDTPERLAAAPLPNVFFGRSKLIAQRSAEIEAARKAREERIAQASEKLSQADEQFMDSVAECENRALEYDRLLDAYNSYMDNMDSLWDEYDILVEKFQKEAEKIKAMPLFEEITALVTEIKNKIAKLEEIKMAAEYLLAPPDPFNVPIIPPEATAYRSEAGIKSLAAEIDLLKEILYC